MPGQPVSAGPTAASSAFARDGRNRRNKHRLGNPYDQPTGFAVSGLSNQQRIVSGRGRSDNLNAASNAAFAVDHLPAIAGAHAGTESELARPFNLADAMGIVHDDCSLRAGYLLS